MKPLLEINAVYKFYHVILSEAKDLASPPKAGSASGGKPRFFVAALLRMTKLVHRVRD